MKVLTSYLRGLTALGYACLGAASIKTKKCSRCMLQNQEKCTSRKNDTWKTEGRKVAKQ